MERKITIKKIQCPSCGRQNIIFRRQDKIYWCRVCGNEWKKKKK